MAKDKLFRQKAPGIMRDLIADFAILSEDAAAIVGNAGHECAGFLKMQEIKPTVQGSRGGYGWFQWTGSRRRAFEAWCEARKLDPASDKANYGFLCHELKGSQKRAIATVIMADSLEKKVEAFELAYERAGVKHYESRVKWARIALEEYERSEYRPEQEDVADQEPDARPDPVPVPRARPDDVDPSPEDAPAPTPGVRGWLKRKWMHVTGGTGAAGLLTYLTDPWAIVAIIGCLAGLALLVFLLALCLFGRERVAARIARWLP